MARQLVHPDERLLTAAQCADRCHVHESDWWAVARDNLVLQRARVQWRGKTCWLASGVARWLQTLAGARGEQTRGASGRAALAARRKQKQEVTE